MARENTKTLLGLHLLLAIYSLCSICGKLASNFTFLSWQFILCYSAMIAVLGIYALGWQQVIKRMPLTSAYANKAVTIVWGIIWGALLFHEPLTPMKLLGAAIVLFGVVLFFLSDEGDV